MSRAGILIAIIALAALTLSPQPSLAQSLTQQAERPGSGRASANTAAASRGRPDEPAPRLRPVVKKPHNYEPAKPAKPEKPYRPAKPEKPYKPGKHEEPDWCHPEAYCDTDEECHAMYPCKYTKCETSRRYTDKTWQKQGKCVCEGYKYKDGPCAPTEPFPDDCTSIDPNIGRCYSGECKPIPRDEGCPCGADDANCKAGLKDKQLACLNTDQSCKCGGNGETGVCVPNYLPQGTVCDATDAGITLGVCEIAKCNENNKCKATNLKQGTGCFIGNNVQCKNAGTCGPDPDPAVVIATPDDTYVCNSIECPPEPPVTDCNTRPDRGSLGQPCDLRGGGKGICCVDPLSGSDPKDLDCVEKTQCPCLPDNNNPECPADQVCCDTGDPLGDPDNFECISGTTCNAIPCSSEPCGLQGSSGTELAFGYCSNGCGSPSAVKQGCANSCATCSSNDDSLIGFVATNCNNANSGTDPKCGFSGNFCTEIKQRLGYDVSTCCVCKNSQDNQAGCCAPDAGQSCPNPPPPV